jgi:hypothetical protein
MHHRAAASLSLSDQFSAAPNRMPGEKIIIEIAINAATMGITTAGLLLWFSSFVFIMVPLSNCLCFVA